MAETAGIMFDEGSSADSLPEGTFHRQYKTSGRNEVDAACQGYLGTM